MYIWAPSFLSTALAEFLSVSFSISACSIALLYQEAVSVYKQSDWNDGMRDREGSLCTHLLPWRSNQDQSTMATHNTTALLVETTCTGFRLWPCARCWWVFMAQLYNGHLSVSCPLMQACFYVLSSRSLNFVIVLFNQKTLHSFYISFTGCWIWQNM